MKHFISEELENIGKHASIHYLDNQTRNWFTISCKFLSKPDFDIPGVL